MTPEFLLPVQWAAPDRVKAACSTRGGGVSSQPYASLNLGDHVGDDAAAVRENRERFARAIGARPIYMRQVHRSHAITLSAATADGAEADVCVTRESGVACTIMVADCMPILFASDDARAVGAAHAGWRGLSQGVAESACDAMASLGASASQLVAWLGPCIGPRAFEVGVEVKEAFEAVDATAADCFVPYREGKWLCDLPALARMRLRKAGVTRIAGNDGTDAWCTVANPSQFFSHRRDRVSGRFAAAVWLA